MMVFVGDPLYSPSLFNTAITPQSIPRVSVTGAKTGQFYMGDITLSISLPASPAVAGVKFVVNGGTTSELTQAPFAGILNVDQIPMVQM
jgi:hypothetical protein